MTTTVLERSTISIPAKSRPRLGSKKLALACLTLAVGLGTAWYGYDWWTVGRFIESTDDAYAGGDITAISPHVAGFVSQILVTDNQYVHAGQLLIRLDDRDFQATLDHADAIVRQREATLASLHAKYVLQQSANPPSQRGPRGQDGSGCFFQGGGTALPQPGANKLRIAAKCTKGSRGGPGGAVRRLVV